LTHQGSGSWSCESCFGPLDAVYDWEALAATVTAETIAAGPSTLWRYAPLLPVEAPDASMPAPGLTPLMPAPRLADRLGVNRVSLKLETANPTHSFKDRAVAVAAAKARELGLTTLSCSSTGNLANAVAARAAAEGMGCAVFCPAELEAEKLVATAVHGARVFAIGGSYDECSRLTVELASELPWGFVNVNLRPYYAEGSKTIAFEIAEQLDWETPDAVVCPIGSGALFARCYKGFRELTKLGLLSREPPRMYGAQAEGCAPVVTTFERGAEQIVPVRPQTLAQSIAIGDPADGDLALAAARSSAGQLISCPESEIAAMMTLLAETSGVFAESATGVCLGALARAVELGAIDSDEHVVIIVSGDGLKTPGPVAGLLEPIEVQADLKAVLAHLTALDHNGHDRLAPKLPALGAAG